jgi:hypothetical protein
MHPATTATGKAIRRYAIVMLGLAWRTNDTATVPTMPRNKLTANEIRVPIHVTSKTRIGIVYQRGARARDGGGIFLTYTNSASITELLSHPAKPDIVKPLTA